MPDVPSSSWGRSRLYSLALAMQGQEHVGALGGLLLRAARFLGGDPASPVTVAAASGVSTGLPDFPQAESAVLQVTGFPCNYRLDGAAPTAADSVLQVGTFITLTGRPSIQSFRFAGTAAGTSTLTGSYFN